MTVLLASHSLKPPAQLVERIAALPLKGRRRLVAIAGAPASGKSTLAAALTEHLAQTGHTSANVPMDGFHLDNRLLDEAGLRARKGAPETFDAGGFVAMMRRLKSEDEVCFPLFDRGRDLAVAGAGRVGPDCDLAIVEGNYLLFDEPPWNALAPLWDLPIWIDTPEELVLKRTVERWLAHDHTPEAARARAEGNDLPNARRIIAARLPSDVTVAVPPDAGRL
jgi:fructokinase